MIPKKIEEKIRSFSPPFIPWVYKAHLIAAVVLAFVIPLTFVAIPYLEWFNDMAVQPKGKAQGHYGWFTDDELVVQRLPVEGTMPMSGYAPYRITGTDIEETARRAGEALHNPLAPTTEVLERGEKYYNIFCIVCHG